MTTSMRYLSERIKILNATGRPARPEELATGQIIEPSPEEQEQLNRALALPTNGVYGAGCIGEKLAILVKELGYKGALIEGPPFITESIEISFTTRNLEPVYSFFCIWNGEPDLSLVCGSYVEDEKDRKEWEKAKLA